MLVVTHPDTARTTGSGTAREFGDDGSGAEVAGHGEVGDAGCRTVTIDQQVSHAHATVN